MYDEKCLLRIGSNIKLLRSVRQLNQHQLAERLGISQTHLSNIEHNNVLVSLKLLVRSANVLGCSLEALLDRAAAVEWAGAHCTDGGEEAENKGKSECKSRCGTDAEGQEQYSLEEVRLHTPEGPVLVVGGADLMDGTPIYDIKPYLPYADCHPEATGGFAEEKRHYALTVDFPAALEARIDPAHRAALRGVLAHDPRPSYQSDPERLYGVAFAGKNVKFTVEDGVLTVRKIEEI